MDDIQDYWLESGQITPMDIFLSKNQSLSLGLIMNGTGNDSKIIDKVKEGFDRGLFELALHGYDHVDYTKLTEEEQRKTLEMANAKLYSIFGIKTVIFIPPDGTFNNDTIKAMELNGISVLGSAVYSEDTFDGGKSIFNASNISKIRGDASIDKQQQQQQQQQPSVFHIPEAVSFEDYKDGKWIKNSINSLIGNVTENIDKYGYASIVIHPQDFVKLASNNTFVDIVDENETLKLSNLIDSIKAKNITIFSFSSFLGIPRQIPPLPVSDFCPDFTDIKGKKDYNSLRVPYPIELKGLDVEHCAIAQIYNKYGKYLYEESSKLNLSPSTLASTLYVESRGTGFGPDGKMTIRFEACDFYNLWGKDHKKEFDDYFHCDKGGLENFNDQFRSSPNEQFVSYHGNQDKEWKVFQLARNLDENAALNSISMGMGQIMGFNHNKIGYSEVNQMFNNMSGSIKSQLDGFFSAIAYRNNQTNVSCLEALKENNYVGFAHCYNASGQDELYGSKIKLANIIYKELTQGKLYGG